MRLWRTRSQRPYSNLQRYGPEVSGWFQVTISFGGKSLRRNQPTVHRSLPRHNAGIRNWDRRPRRNLPAVPERRVDGGHASFHMIRLGLRRIAADPWLALGGQLRSRTSVTTDIELRMIASMPSASTNRSKSSQSMGLSSIRFTSANPLRCLNRLRFRCRRDRTSDAVGSRVKISVPSIEAGLRWLRTRCPNCEGKPSLRGSR
ncbi:hypothetical protein BH23ACT4_BH23ACT4_09800 [soil metagenome]